MDGKDKTAKPHYWEYRMTTFCEARFDVLRQNLNAQNQAKWDGLSYAKKCSVVLGLVRDGTIV